MFGIFLSYLAALCSYNYKQLSDLNGNVFSYKPAVKQALLHVVFYRLFLEIFMQPFLTRS